MPVLVTDVVPLRQLLCGKPCNQLFRHIFFIVVGRIRGQNSVFYPTLALRTETYAKAGSLPVVTHANLSEDISRRDFTINTLAVSLNPLEYGLLVDQLGGRIDIENEN